MHQWNTTIQLMYLQMPNTWKDISDGLDHFIWSFTMHNGVLYAAQWDADSSLIRYDGVLDVEKEEGVIPQQFNLSQNYPNLRLILQPK